MKNNIKELEIKNFKSIKHIKFNPKRVNVIIGKPNVGKSNILEGMSLMTALYNTNNNNPFFMSDKILRYSDMFNLFYDENTEETIMINSVSSYGESNVTIDYDGHLFTYVSLDNRIKRKIIEYSDILSKEIIRDFFFNYNGNNAYKSLVQESGFLYLNNFFGQYYKDGVKNQSTPLYLSNAIIKNPVKRYSYQHFEKYNGLFRVFLEPPFGENLFTVLNNNKELLNEVGGFIEEQGLEFVLDKKENKFIIQKKIDRIVYQVPYSNIADTLRHVIFYLAAIETNKDSVLLFEEPEVHSYPPYIKMLADRIVLNDENQYFISTHSPYMLNTLIDSLGDDELNVVLTYYEDYQTKIKILSAEELAEVQEWKTDIFFNIDRFINHLQEK